jgi:type IV secretory pathway VirB6-like protein
MKLQKKGKHMMTNMIRNSLLMLWLLIMQLCMPVSSHAYDTLDICGVTGLSSAFCPFPILPRQLFGFPQELDPVSGSSTTIDLPADGCRGSCNYPNNPATPPQFNQWLDSGVSVSQGEQFYITIAGDVFLDNFLGTFKIPANQPPTTILKDVKQGDVISIIVDYNSQVGISPNTNNPSGVCTSAYGCYASGARCLCKYGEGLQVYLNNQLFYKNAIPNTTLFDSVVNYQGSTPPQGSIEVQSYMQDYFTRLSNSTLSTDPVVFPQLMVLRIPSDGTLSLGIASANPANASGQYVVAVSRGNPDNAVSAAMPSNGQRGGVEYLVQDSLQDPNLTHSLADGVVVQDFFSTQAARNGHLYFRLHNINGNGPPPNVTITQNDNGTFLIPALNSGSYKIDIQTNNDQSMGLSSAMISLTQSLRANLDSGWQMIYVRIIKNTHFKRIVMVALSLYVILYALLFTLGYVRITQSDMITRFIKIAIVAFVISDQSLSWFLTYVKPLFWQGMDWLMVAASNNTSNGSNVDNNIFYFADVSLGKFFNKDMWIRIAALLFTIPTLPMGLMLISAFIQYFLIIFQMMLVYIFAMIGISFMFAIAPFMILAYLFDVTKPMFDSWVRFLVSFSIQPFLMIATFLIVNQATMTILMGALNYKAKFGCAITLHIFLPNPLYYIISVGSSFIDIILPICLAGYLPEQVQSTSVGADIIGSINFVLAMFVQILLALIFVKVLGETIKLSGTLGRILTQAFGSELGNLAASVVDDIKSLKPEIPKGGGGGESGSGGGGAARPGGGDGGST